MRQASIEIRSRLFSRCLFSENTDIHGNSRELREKCRSSFKKKVYTQSQFAFKLDWYALDEIEFVVSKDGQTR